MLTQYLSVLRACRDERCVPYLYLLRLTDTVPTERVILANPFDFLYVTVLDKDNKRVYNKISPARARVTGAVDQKIDRFVKDVELWSVGDDGWQLIFSAKTGDHYSKISWQTVIESNKTRAAKYEEWRKEQEEARAREVYDKLKARFEG